MVDEALLPLPPPPLLLLLLVTSQHYSTMRMRRSARLGKFLSGTRHNNGVEALRSVYGFVFPAEHSSHACIHRFIHRDHLFICISYQVIMMVIIVYHHHHHHHNCYFSFCFRQPRGPLQHFNGASCYCSFTYMEMMMGLVLSSKSSESEIRCHLSTTRALGPFLFIKTSQGPLEARLFVRYHLRALSKGRNLLLPLEHGEWSERRRSAAAPPPLYTQPAIATS